MSKLSSYLHKQTAHGLSLNGLKSSVKGAVHNPLTYAAASLLIPGVAPLALNALKAGAGAVGSGIGALGHGAASVAGGLGGVAKSVAPMAISALTGGHGLSGLLDRGLGAAQVVNAANLQKQSTGYAKDALNTVNQSYDARAPLRVAGIEGLLHPQTPDLSSLTQVPGNPFAPKKPLPIPVQPRPLPTGPDVTYGN